MGQTGESPFGSATSDSVSLKGDIYFLPEGATSLPDFSSLTSAGSIYAKSLDIPTRSFTSGFPGVTDRFEWFAIRYTGTFYVDREGDYAFRLVSDDGSRLFIDGNKIVDNDGVHPTQSASGNAYLSRGQHSIEVDYFQGPREEIALQLFWTVPGGTEVISEPAYIPLPQEEGAGTKPTEGTGDNQGTGSSQGIEPSYDTGPSLSGCTWCPVDMTDLDLTGVWGCDDGGYYYIKQHGNVIWWEGESDDDYDEWYNVAHGVLSNCVLTLEYSDVPESSAEGTGTLVIEVLSNNEMQAREKPDSFFGSNWWRVS
jgi:hypothetical protein